MKAKIYGVSKTENDILPLEKIKIVTSIEEGKTVIDGGTILTDSVNAKSIAANAITTNKLAADSITGEKIKANTIDVNKLKTHQIVLPNTNYGGVKITDEGMIAESKGNKIILSSDVGLLVQNKKTNKDVLSLDATTGEVSLDVAKLSISSNSVATENYVQDKSDSAVSESKKHTDEQIESININERNLLKDTSEDWTEITFKDFTPSSIVYKPEQIGLSIRDSIVYSMEIDNSIDKNNTSGSRVSIDFFDSNDALLDTMLGTVIKSGEKDKSIGKIDIPNNTSYMKIHDAYKAETGKTKTLAVRRQKLQRGKYATDWTPAPEDARDYADSVSDKAQDKALKESKTYTDNKIEISEDGITLGYKEYTDNKVESLDINDKNLFLGSYNEWLTKTFKNYTDGNHHIKLEDVGLNQGDTITFSIDIDNSIDKENKDEARAVFNFYDKSGNRISSTSSYIPLPSVEYGQVERISRTEIIPEGTYDIQIFDFSKTEDEKEKTLAVRRQKLQRGNRATDWTPAYQDTIQESLDKAVEYTDSEIKTAKDGIKLEYKSYTDDEVNKAKAQSKKDIETTNREVKEAKSSAQEANKSIADMAKDTILSKIEKKTLQTDWDVIHSEYPRLKAQGEKYDIDTTDYIDSYSSLESYIEPILKDKNQDTTIVPSTFKKKFTNYYDEKLSLMNLVNDKVKELGDKAVEEAYDYVDSQIKLTKDGISLDYKNYTDGKIEDSEERNKKTVTELKKSITQAKTSADSANKSIADMAKDTILSPIEKTSLAKEWEAIQSEYPKLKAQAKKYEVSDKKLNAKYSSLKEYITPLLKEVDKDSTIKPTSFKQVFKDYYDEKLDIMNLINDRIKELGDIAVGEAYEYVDSQIDMTKEGIVLGYKKYTDDKVDAVDVNDRNLLRGLNNPTSEEWEEGIFSGWTAGYMTYKLEDIGVKVGDELTYTAEYDNSIDEENTSSVKALVNFYSKEKNPIGRIEGSWVKSGEVGFSSGTKAIPKDTVKVQAYKFYKGESKKRKIVNARKHKLQVGNKATKWTPAPEDLVEEATNESKKYTDSQIKLSEEGISLGYKNYTDGKIKDVEERNKKTVTELEKSITQAKTSADSANQSIADMAKDTILSPLEKPSLAKEWETIQSEYPKLKAQAKKYEVSYTKLDAKYSSLKEYITPLLKEMDKDSTIKPTSFKQTFKEYYDEKLDIMNLINDRIKELGDIAVGEAYEYVDSQIDITKDGIKLSVEETKEYADSSSNKAEQNAKDYSDTSSDRAEQNAKDYADSSSNKAEQNAKDYSDTSSDRAEQNAKDYADSSSNKAEQNAKDYSDTEIAKVGKRVQQAEDQIDESNKILVDMSKDDVLSPIDKKSLSKEWEQIQSEYPKLIEQGNKYGTNVRDIEASYSALEGYLIPIISQMGENTETDSKEFRTKFKEYYDDKLNLMNDVSDEVRKLGDAAASDAENRAKVYTDSQIDITKEGIVLGYKKYTDDKVDAVEPGSKNLLLGSDTYDKSGVSSNNAKKYPIFKEELEEDKEKFVRVKRNLNEGDQVRFSIYNNLKPKHLSTSIKGKEIIMSTKVRASEPAQFKLTSSTSEGGLPDSGKLVDVDTEWKTISSEPFIAGDVEYLRFIPFELQQYKDHDLNDFYLDLGRFWITEGNKTPKDWIPAPEDISKDAVSSAKNYTDSQIKLSEDGIKLGYKNYTDEKVDNQKAGGRNLLLKTDNLWADKESKDFKTPPYKDLTPGIYVLSADIEIVNAHPKPGSHNSRLGLEFKVAYESEKAEWLNSFYYPKEGENYKGRIHSIIEIKDTITWIGQKGLFANQIEGDIVRVGLPKLERGNVPTDWTPAPEDLVEEATNESKKYTDSQIKLSEDGISLGYKKYTDDKVRDIDINDRNLLKGSSDKWQKLNFSGWNYYLIDKNDPFYVNEGETYTASVLVKDVKTAKNGVGLWFFGYSSDDEWLYESKESDIDRVEEGKVKHTITIPKKVDYITMSIRNPVSGETVTLSYKEAKLQKGNRATEWTPAPEDLVEEATNKSKKYTDSQIKLSENGISLGYKKYTDEKVGNLDINDRNLLLNSSNPLSRWRDYKGSAFNTKQVDMTEEWGTENAYEFSISGGTHPIKVLYTTTKYVSEPMVFDQEYTYSIFIKNTGKNKFRFYVNGLRKTENSGAMSIQIKPGESKRLSFTGVRRDNYDWFQPMVRTRNDYVDDDLKMIMAMEKIQKGNKATDWTPAPEDTDSKIDSKIDSIDINDRNLLEGTSDKWKDFRIDGWHTPLQSDLKLSDLGLLIGDSVAYSVEIDDTLEKSEEVVNLGLFFHDKNKTKIGQVYSNSDNRLQNDKGRIKVVTTIPEKAESIFLTINRPTNEGARIFKYRKAKLQKGDRATLWTPSSKDVVDQSVSQSSSYTDAQIKLAEEGMTLGYKKYTDDQLSNQEIGGTNLLLDSDRNIKMSSSSSVTYDMSEKMEEITYTLTLKGKLGKGKSSFKVYISDGYRYVGGLKSKGNNIYQGTFEGRTDAGNLKKLIIYALPNSVKTESEIEWAKLEKGNTATAWSPAPSDIESSSISSSKKYTDSQIKLSEDDIKLNYQKYTDNKVSSSEKETNDTINGIQSSGENLIQNGNFENGFTGWDPAASASLTNNGRTSGKAVRMRRGSTKLVTSIPVEPGRTYEFGYWYRTSSDFDGAVDNTKMRLGAPGGGLIDSKSYNGNTTEWKKLTRTTKIKSEDIYSLKISIVSAGSKGWIDFSEVYFIDITRYNETESSAKKYTESQIKLSEDGIKLGYKQYTDNRVDNIDINDRNLLPNTSDEWEEATFSGWTSGTEVIAIKDIGLSPGDTFTYTMEIDNTRDQKNTDNVRGLISFRTDDGTKLTQRVTKEVKTGKIERVSFTAKIPEKTAILWVHRFSKTESGKTKTFAARKHKLQRGSYSTDWTPAPEDTDSKIDSIDINDRNLIVANNLKAHPYFTTTPKVEKGGRKVWVKWKTHPGNLIAINVGGFRPEGLYTLSARIEINGKPVTSNRFPSKKIHSSHQDSQNKRFDISDDGRLIATEQFNGNDNGCIFHTYMNDMNEGDIVTFYDFKFQKGNKATEWTPAPEDLVEEATNESKKYTDNQISITEEGIKSKVDKDGVISQINQSSEGVLIDGAKHHITGKTKIDNAVITSAMIKDIDASRVTVSANSGKKSVRMTKDGFVGYDSSGKLRLLIGVQDLAGDGQSDPSNVVFYSGNGKKSVSVGTNVDDTFVIGSETSGVTGLVRIPKQLTLESDDVIVMGGTNKSDYGDYWRFGTSTVGGKKHVVMTTDRPYAGVLGHSHRFLRKIYTTDADIRRLDVGYGFNNPQEGDFSVRKDSRSGFIMSKVTTTTRTYDVPANVRITRNGVFGKAISASKYKLNIQNLKQEEALDLGNRLLTLNPSKWWSKDGTEGYVSELDGDDDFVDENNVSPYYGMVAEDLRDVGLDPYIEHDEKTGEIEGIQYDRLWTPLIPIIREQRAEIEKLKIEIEKLKIEVEKLMRGGDA